MTIAARENEVARRHSFHRCVASARAAAVIAASAMMLAACGGSDAPIVPPPDTVDTSTLAGTWKGSVTGSYGFSNITTLLRADSTMRGDAENVLYCTVLGTWTVSGGQYIATGRDCTNTAITFIAPIDPRRLTGTWTASSGRSGTFTIAKQ